MVILKLLFGLTSFFLFLYIFWLKLKEDYLVDTVFSVAFISLITGLGAYLLLGRFFPAFSLWIFLFGLFIGLVLALWKFRFRFFESYEALVGGTLPAIASVFLWQYLSDRNWATLYYCIFVWWLFVFYFFIDNHYKKFTWYKSGRVGFTGLFTAGIFFLIRALIASFYPAMVSLVGVWDIYLSGVLALINFGLLVKLARQL